MVSAAAGHGQIQRQAKHSQVRICRWLADAPRVLHHHSSCLRGSGAPGMADWTPCFHHHPGMQQVPHTVSVGVSPPALALSDVENTRQGWWSECFEACLAAEHAISPLLVKAFPASALPWQLLQQIRSQPAGHRAIFTVVMQNIWIQRSDGVHGLKAFMC